MTFYYMYIVVDELKAKNEYFKDCYDSILVVSVICIVVRRF
jgi:hypothetical protein